MNRSVGSGPVARPEFSLALAGVLTHPFEDPGKRSTACRARRHPVSIRRSYQCNVPNPAVKRLAAGIPAELAWRGGWRSGILAWRDRPFRRENAPDESAATGRDDRRLAAAERRH